MERFQFLKTFGIALGVGVLTSKPLVAGSLPVTEPATPTPRFRPGARGQILASSGQGGWVHHAGFGPDFEVVSIHQERGATMAQLRFRNLHDFHLQLDLNGKDWKVL
jgi:hypothetical protein